MCRAKLFFGLARLGCMVAVGFFSGSVFTLGVRAQPAIPSERPSGPSPLVTNLLELSQLLDSSSRLIADVRLELVVCSASRPELGVVAVQDKTGSEVLELGFRRAPIVAGDRIRLEGRRCLLRRREVGIEITRAPELDNDGIHSVRGVTTEVRFTPGLHAFQLDYFNHLAACALDLTCRLPDGSIQRAERFLVRPGGGDAPESDMVAGVNADYYEGQWVNVPDFALFQRVKAVTTTNLNPILGPQKELFGIRFKGFFAAPMAGVYAFTLESDDGSLLFLDAPDIPLATIGHEDVPSPIVSPSRAPMTDSEAPQWISIKGRVAFVSRCGRGLQFEFYSAAESILVTVAEGRELDPIRLLNSRIRVSGIGRAVMTPNRERVLGELSVVTGDDITFLEDAAVAMAPPDTAPAMVAVGKIQGLSKEEAARHLPVRIQGVVTSIAPPIHHYMSVQDETRGIFVRLPSTARLAAAAGQLCEVVGYTDAGDFAPIVVGEDILVLGKGQMPSPARPTWKELINGSMDLQWVELRGLVTAVHGNSLALLLPDGELEVEVGAFSELQLKPFESAVIRLRGVLFAAWNPNRTVQVGRLLMRNATIEVEVPAARDAFDVALKSWSELYQFDPQATPFQRVRVRGAVIYADARRVFLMDKAGGICASPVEPGGARFGEEVEVVGYSDISGPAPLLRKARLRKTGRIVAPTPLELDGGEVMPEKADSRLVRISATLMGMHSEPDARVLEMNAGGNLFLARMPHTRESVSPRIGSKLALTGVYIGKALTGPEGAKPSGFELLLNSPAQLTVLSQPSWWTPQRLLVMVGLLLAILALAGVWISQLRRLVEQRTRQLQRETHEREAVERERVVESERSRIARDLHDDLGSSLTEISVLASKGQRLGTLDELTALFRTITAKARASVTALDVIVWAVDPKDNSLESVADYLGDFASEYLSHSGITCRFDIPVALPAIVLDGQLRHGLLLAVKEILHNVERHAQASEVQFRMTFAEDQLDIIIADNGRGFDTKAKHRGNGLRNVPLRLAKLGGRCTIESSKGKGTMVTIGVRFASGTERMPAGKPA